MRIYPLLRHPASLFLILCLGAFNIYAQDSDSDDPPDRVARLSYLKGVVSLKPAGTDDWADANVNRPLTTDDELWVERDGRAELQLGAVDIHLDSETAFSLSELSDNVLQARITEGAIHLNVRHLEDGETIEIDTPQAAVTVNRPGEYHIEVIEDGARTLVKTYSGEIEVNANDTSQRLRTREQATFSDSGQSLASRNGFAPRDEFDAWSNDRNQRFTRSASSRYVAPGVIGYEELDGYGDWASESDYGYVWYPTRVAVDWSPYRFGHWAWISPWGWTWVDNAPWGFAPFHYGRWAQVHGRWGWVPGPVHERAVYAPALVGWIGLPSPRGGISVSFSSDIGWFPLAPREVYVPSYRCSRAHMQNINIANTVIVNNTIINRAYVNRATHIDYVNRNLGNAVTIVHHDAFIGARSVNDHRVRIDDRKLRDWQTQNSTPTLAPERASLLGPRWNANSSRAPARWEQRNSREVVVRHELPPARASFEVEQRAIRQNNNIPPSRRELRTNVEPLRSEPRRSEPAVNDRPQRAFESPQERNRPTPRIQAPQIQTPQAPVPPRNDNQRRQNDRFNIERRDEPQRGSPEQPRTFTPPAAPRVEQRAPQFTPQPAQQPTSQPAPPRAEPSRTREHFERPERNIERERPAETHRPEISHIDAPRRVEPPPQPRQPQRVQPPPQAAPVTAPAAPSKRDEERGRERAEQRETDRGSRR